MDVVSMIGAGESLPPLPPKGPTMNWMNLLSTVLRLMPNLLPSLLRALADALEKDPRALDQTLQEITKRS